jgi:imidazolonepropionase-like amidohydrolase
MQRHLFGALAVVVTATALGAQQPPTNPNARQNFVKIDSPVVVLTHVRVIDGTGAPARENQTIVIRDGKIAAVNDTPQVTLPAGANIIDLPGRTVIPGLVMMHEHLYYTAGAGVYGQYGASFVRLYLAGGVTTMRTAGNTNGIMDMNLARRIAAGELVGPAIDATGPYLNGPNTQLQMHSLVDAADARRQVAYWADMGATSFKAYMQITRDELKASIDDAHKRGLKLTGHLCSVTYGEAADLGIDNLEHGFMAATDFVPDKKPDECPGQAKGQQTIAALDENGAPFKALVKKLVDKHVALTSTMTVFETFTPGRPTPLGLDVLVAPLREQFQRAYDRVQQNQQSLYKTLFPKGMALERAFAKAGGLLTAGTDPTGSGGVIPGFADQREIELLVDAGFSPVQAISIATLNGAKYLGRDAKIGTIAAGKQADLVVVNGDPSRTVEDVRRVETVFKAGVGYDPVKLVQSVSGQVGIW